MSEDSTIKELSDAMQSKFGERCDTLIKGELLAEILRQEREYIKNFIYNKSPLVLLQYAIELGHSAQRPLNKVTPKERSVVTRDPAALTRAK